MAKKKELPKETLMTLYLEEKKTCDEIAELYETTPNTVKARLLEHGIPVRSRSEARMISLERGLAFTRKGCLPWNRGLPRTSEEKAKMSVGQKARYASGAVHPNQGKHLALETRQKIAESNKVAQTRLWQDLSFKEQQLKKMLGGVIPTPHESKLIALIEKHNLPFRWNANGELMLGFYIPDFVGIGNNCLIEVHDDGRGKGYHIKRTNVFASYGFRVLFITNGEIDLPNGEDICLAKINEFIASSLKRD